MDNWGTEEKKKNGDVTRKILVAIMIVLVLIIILIAVLLYNINTNTFRIIIDGETQTDTAGLLQTVDNTTYINIQKLATLLGYGYHAGEYKVFSSDEDKCYIESTNETASFYLNSNKICKLEVDHLDEDYEVFMSEKNIIAINNLFYAPIDAIEVSFNVKIEQTENGMSVITLDTLLQNINNTINSDETYNSLLEEDFKNQKAVLYDYIILSKTDSGVYGVITTDGREILADRYQSIEFSESTQEFFVTNSLGKMGIVDKDGKNIIEQNYDSIKLIHNDPKLYLVAISEKYGVLDETGRNIIYPEYDSIGVDSTIYTDIQNQYVLLDSVIPVCQNNQYGLFDITGNKILDVQYEGIGCELETVNINGATKAVNPVVSIEECEGIVIKNGEVYDLFYIPNNNLISLKVSSIYYIKDAGETKYYMVYKEQELDLINSLIKANVINAPNELQSENNATFNNTVNSIDNEMVSNQTENNITTTITQ